MNHMDRVVILIDHEFGPRTKVPFGEISVNDVSNTSPQAVRFTYTDGACEVKRILEWKVFVMFWFPKRNNSYFVVSSVDEQNRWVLVEDLTSGKRIKIGYGSKELQSANFEEKNELVLIYQDGSKKKIDVLS